MVTWQKLLDFWWHIVEINHLSESHVFFCWWLGVHSLAQFRSYPPPAVWSGIDSLCITQVTMIAGGVECAVLHGIHDQDALSN